MGPTRRSLSLSVCILLVAAGCASNDPGAAASAAERDLPQGDEKVELDPRDFTTRIDNPYWPMTPGTRWVYHEIEDGGRLKVVVTVTDQVRQLANGITARVVRDSVYEDGSLIEDTNDWYAQDDLGNLWYMGESTAEFEDGKLVTRAGSFEAGKNGAQPGIMIPADPQPGMSYRQEYLAGEAEDNGAVLSVEEMADVPYGHFDEMLMTKDTNALEPRVLEYKLYARGVGPVLILGVSGGAGREELISMKTVPPGTATEPLGAPSR